MPFLLHLFFLFFLRYLFSLSSPLPFVHFFKIPIISPFLLLLFFLFTFTERRLRPRRLQHRPRPRRRRRRRLPQRWSTRNYVRRKLRRKSTREKRQRKRESILKGNRFWFSPLKLERKGLGNFFFFVLTPSPLQKILILFLLHVIIITFPPSSYLWS